MAESREEQISNLRKIIDANEESKYKINRMRQEMEEFQYNKIKRLERYINSESLSDADRMDYFDKIHESNKSFLELDDEYENAIRQLNKSNEEYEEQIRELGKQDEEENDLEEKQDLEEK